MYFLQGASSPLCLLAPKVIILQGYSSHNTTIISGVYNLSTTCFGQCCCVHHHNCPVLCHIYLASMLNCIHPHDGHNSIGRNMQLISYINLIIQLCYDCYILIELLPQVTTIYLSYFTLTTCFGQLTIIRPFLQNSVLGATRCK